ncbi:hypothetical protein D3C81_1671850 [compost metagenome]
MSSCTANDWRWPPFIDRTTARVAPAALNTMKQQLRFMEGKALDFVMLGGGGTDYYRAASLPRSKSSRK